MSRLLAVANFRATKGCILVKDAVREGNSPLAVTELSRAPNFKGAAGFAKAATRLEGMRRIIAAKGNCWVTRMDNSLKYETVSSKVCAPYTATPAEPFVQHARGHNAAAGSSRWQPLVSILGRRRRGPWLQDGRTSRRHRAENCVSVLFFVDYCCRGEEVCGRGPQKHQKKDMTTEFQKELARCMLCRRCQLVTHRSHRQKKKTVATLAP